jgi:hypothetical protein
LLLSSLELSDTKLYESLKHEPSPHIRARFLEVCIYVLKQRPSMPKIPYT